MEAARQKTAFAFGLKHRRSATVVWVSARHIKPANAPIRGPWTLKAVVGRG